MRKLILALILFLSLNFNINPFYQNVYQFSELSVTSRPIELRVIRGTGSQTGLTAGLYNHDSKPHRLSINRNLFLKSLSGGIQSMVIADNSVFISDQLINFNSVYAIDWESQKSKPVYYYDLAPNTLTEISINAVCAELYKNPPSESNCKYSVYPSPFKSKLNKIYASIDTINMNIIPRIRSAIVSQSGNMVSLSRPLTEEETIVFHNTESFPDRKDEAEKYYINFNTLNWAIWAVTDSLNGDIMKKKILEWSVGLASSEEIRIQIEMTKLILEKSGLNEYADKF